MNVIPVDTSSIECSCLGRPYASLESDREELLLEDLGNI